MCCLTSLFTILGKRSYGPNYMFWFFKSVFSFNLSRFYTTNSKMWSLIKNPDCDFVKTLFFKLLGKCLVYFLNIIKQHIFDNILVHRLAVLKTIVWRGRKYKRKQKVSIPIWWTNLPRRAKSKKKKKAMKQWRVMAGDRHLLRKVF